MRIEWLIRFKRAEDGAVAIIVSLLLVVLMGFVALGVDTASLYRERAQLQSVSDLAAISAVALPDDANARALHTMGRNSKAPGALDELQTGRFLRNPAIPPEDRFTPLAAGDRKTNAVRVVLQDDAPLHFAKIFTDDTHITLDRTALASRTGAVSFSLDSHLVRLGGASLNDALQQRFGAGANISIGNMQLLADADIDLGSLLEALDSRIGGGSLNPAEILNATTTAGDIIASLQSVLTGPLANSLSGLAGAAGSATFDVSSLVGGIDTELGLTATEFLADIEVSALDVIKALVAAETTANGTTLDTAVSVPGVLSATANLVAGEPPARSGWVALGEEDVQLHRAAIRLESEIEVEPDLLGPLGVGIEVASLHVPIYTELAGSTATLDRMACHITSPQGIAASFETSPTPLHPMNGTSVAALYLGTLPEGTGPVDPATLAFADLLTVSISVKVPPLIDLTIPGVVIQARSYVAVGQSQQETLSFTHTEVADGNITKHFGSGELLSTAVTSLLSSDRTELRVKPQQAGLIAGLAAPVVENLLTILPAKLLSGLATPVDAVLDGTLSTIGVNLGEGELTLTGHHCEPIRLVR
ncbi:hypothetical protein Z946_1528 [Sulfitobacter noctilucicola]|uniref:Putative membrane protein n=1 Tax=Sulfitobacter noctilucicola TaxID=1342301 RepID=A0A7W6M6X1_9RHOB|nr:pilus assembly protein TadG-related protein [Sulfitobacter noctilucicola]KIN62665.1 hypothetical protein Z946_1528 [Sulfitobacter noctilucicola]MBB4172802.1 putative membrane protein [Sulfitobacter noctilucicola]